MSNIRRIPLSEKNLIVSFLNENWGSIHPLVNNELMFNYYYTASDMTNFYVWEENGEILAICGYINCSKKENCDIWISIWCAKKGKNGVGLQLMGAMKELTGASVMSCNNIRQNTMNFYRFLGYHPDSITHWYRLSKKSNYKIAVVNNNFIPYSKKVSGVFLREIHSVEELEKCFVIPDQIKPSKDFWYIKKRYFEYPFYKYHIFAVNKDEKTLRTVVFRVNKSDEGFVLRLVDYIGLPEDFVLLSGYVDELMRENDCEFCDMYSFGVDGTLAGFCERKPDDVNIIPNYLNPLWQKNIDYFFFTSDTDNFMMFKADGDQDRPNLG